MPVSLAWLSLNAWSIFSICQAGYTITARQPGSYRRSRLANREDRPGVKRQPSQADWHSDYAFPSRSYASRETNSGKIRLSNMDVEGRDRIFGFQRPEVDCPRRG